jgi:hypothetical protein
MLPGGDGGIIPLLMAMPLTAVGAWAGIGAAKLSRNPKTAAGDEAAEQAKADREARHQAVRGGTE